MRVIGVLGANSGQSESPARGFRGGSLMMDPRGRGFIPLCRPIAFQATVDRLARRSVPRPVERRPKSLGRITAHIPGSGGRWVGVFWVKDRCIWSDALRLSGAKLHRGRGRAELYHRAGAWVRMSSRSEGCLGSKCTLLVTSNPSGGPRPARRETSDRSNASFRRAPQADHALRPDGPAHGELCPRLPHHTDNNMAQ